MTDGVVLAIYMKKSKAENNVYFNIKLMQQIFF